ncbi:DUF3015 family protein [Sulfurimonas sp.]|uniref:DUF3015 family protein n=1 Tax=Sulfurimonas sp. TaxID=2022749 RepID=UPI002AB110CC|nr:DUF3015 family protein [Sulfurimonas sp.]
MKKIILSVALILSLSSVSGFADAMDDIMQSKISKQSTDQSKVTTRGSSKKENAAAQQARLEQFASVNSNQLAKEIAMGHGELVDTLATMLKVDNKSVFVSKLQSNYGNIYTSQDMQTADILKNISKI